MDNWQTMPMMNPNRFRAGRIDQCTVFVPNREGLHPSNEALERAAIVHGGPNHNKQTLPHRLATTLAAQLNRHPRDFEIGKIHASIADFIVIFPTVDLRNHAVHVGVFAIDYNIYVQLAAWKPSQGMVYDPTVHKARIRLHGVPLQNWNLDDIDQLLSGVGHVIKMAPVFTNGNFETIRVLVACHNPILIPETLLMKTNPYATLVTLELEGWLHVPTGLSLPEVSNDRARNQPPRGSTMPHPSLNRTVSEPSEHSRSITDEYQHGADSTYSRRERQTHQWLPKAVQMESPVIARTGEIETGASQIQPAQTKPTKQVLETTKDNTEKASVSIKKAPFSPKVTESKMRESNISNSGEAVVQTAKKDPIQITVTSSLGSVFLHAQFQKSKAINVVLQKINTNIPTLNPRATYWKIVTFKSALFSVAPTGLLQTKGPVLSTLSHSPIESLHISDSSKAQSTSIVLLLDSPCLQEKDEGRVSIELLLDSPPPGFEGPPRYMESIRRSPHLQKKDEGRYISALDKACAVRGYADGNFSTPKKSKRKLMDTQPIQMTYLKSYEPLSATQAEVIISTAGAEMSKHMTEKISELARKNEELADPSAA